MGRPPQVHRHSLRMEHLSWLCGPREGHCGPRQCHQLSCKVVPLSTPHYGFRLLLLSRFWLPMTLRMRLIQTSSPPPCLLHSSHTSLLALESYHVLAIAVPSAWRDYTHSFSYALLHDIKVYASVSPCQCHPEGQPLPLHPKQRPPSLITFEIKKWTSYCPLVYCQNP